VEKGESSCWPPKSLARYTPTYAYEFNDENAPELYLAPVGFPYGAAHESELQYLFSLSNVAHPAPLSTAQQQLAATMKRDWTDLAKTGVPSASWPRYSAAGGPVESLISPLPQVETDYAAEHHCSFWSKVG
jgi:para-nitrobenzyl esterase